MFNWTDLVNTLAPLTICFGLRRYDYLLKPNPNFNTYLLLSALFGFCRKDDVTKWQLSMAPVLWYFICCMRVKDESHALGKLDFTLHVNLEYSIKVKRLHFKNPHNITDFHNN